MLKLYNTLSRKKEILRPRKPPRIRMYVCGPTVYGPGHVGHARTYIAFDIIRRYLEEKGYKVKFVMNITDIHDSIIEEAKNKKIYFLDLANKYTKQFLKEVRALGIKKANAYPRVTKYIPDIIKFVKVLIKKNYAYEEKRSVYFDVSKFKDYGRLSRIKLKAQIPGTRIETDKYEREEAADFALWKAISPEWEKSGKKFLREPSWSSPWGPGRPGWHIECSVMSQKLLGRQFDIHGGAKDLIFPHHENEIAQSEACTGKKPFVKYWMHSGLLTINGQKMSKSLGNYIEIWQALKTWPARLIRIFVANSHYRSPQDWNKKALNQAKKQIERIDEFIDKLNSIKDFNQKLKKEKEKEKERMTKSLVLQTQKEFEKAMDDDFNTPVALAAIFNLIRESNLLFDREKITPADARDILKLLKKIDKVFSFIFWGKRIAPKIPSFIKKMVREREEARKKKDWKLADEIRKKIQWMGFKIEDTPKGPKIKKI